MEKNGKKYFLQGELGWEKNGLDENLWTKHTTMCTNEIQFKMWTELTPKVANFGFVD